LNSSFTAFSVIVELFFLLFSILIIDFSFAVVEANAVVVKLDAIKKVANNIGIKVFFIVFPHKFF